MIRAGFLALWFALTMTVATAATTASRPNGRAMRRTGMAALLALAMGMGDAAAQGGPTPVCADNAVPIETLGSDKEQRQVLLSQANACIQQGKPTIAIALLS